MPERRRAFGSFAAARLARMALLTVVISLAARSALHAQGTATLTTLYSFSGNDLGDDPSALVQGSDGSFYGTTYAGGANNYGMVFRITPAGALTTLYNFTGGSDGGAPAAALVQGGDGNFYGTTYYGGVFEDGTVFRITPAGALTTLYSFSGSSDGGAPYAALVQGGDGNFYGTTAYNGANGRGTVFRITLAGALTTLYSFSGSSDVGAIPEAALVRGSDGSLYGTILYGGSDNEGTVFRITPAGALTTLYNFTGGSDGGAPYAALVQGSDGNFYGTTHSGGSDNEGTVFRITPAGALTTLYNFTGGSDGGDLEAGLIQGSDGNFYGTTRQGGANGYGAVFRITSAGALTTLYSFTGGSDGGAPAVALVQGSDGNFYGTTYVGGASNEGTVFKLAVPGLGSAHPAFFDGEVALTGGVYYLQFPSGNAFGYYSFLSDSAYIYHFDLGYEYVFDANDGNDGVYFYDFLSSDFFYTSPTFPFPYLYDFNLQATLYYYPDTSSPGHYTSSPRYFYNFATQQIITK